jgi:hypothetical protein
MPQVRCPNCGATINLENRKGIDMDMITKAVEHNARTFTDILHVTQLPRKTLSLRLKELRGTGMIVKEDRFYRLNGHSETAMYRRTPIRRLSSLVQNKKVRTGLMLIALVVSIPTFSYALAAMFLFSPPRQPNIVGKFNMVLAVHNVNGVRAWEVVIPYNMSELKLLDVKSGSFLGSRVPMNINGTESDTEGTDNAPFMINKTDIDGDGKPDGALLLADNVYGNVPGKSGDGLLATMTFGYYYGNYEVPKIVSAWDHGKLHLETCWIGSDDDSLKSFDIGSTITLTVASG